jgi:hypothetical protein
MYIGLICYLCQVLIKLELSRQIFEKYWYVKLHENPFSGSRVVPWWQTDGRTDRRDEVNTRFWQFCESVYNPAPIVIIPDKFVTGPFRSLSKAEGKYWKPQLSQRWLVEASWSVTSHAQKLDFVFRRNGRVHLNRQERQCSRLLAAEVCASTIVMLDTPCSEVVWRVLATHSIPQFPLHFTSLRHRVPSHFNWSLTQDTVWYQQTIAKLAPFVWSLG